MILTTCVVDSGQLLLRDEGMNERPRTLTIRLTDIELAKAHALADAGDESIGRYLRRAITSDYERRFGDAPPPTPKLRPGPSRRAE